jgi:hypothetical protein
MGWIIHNILEKLVNLMYISNLYTPSIFITAYLIPWKGKGSAKVKPAVKCRQDILGHSDRCELKNICDFKPRDSKLSGWLK